MNINDLYYLPKWEREFYQNEIIKSFPLHKNKIKLWNDIELMNCYDSENWKEWFEED